MCLHTKTQPTPLRGLRKQARTNDPSHSHMYNNNHKLETLLSSGLDGEGAHSQEGAENEGSRGEDGSVGVGLTRVGGDDRRTETGDSVEARSDSGACAAVRRWENLRRVGVENAVHDICGEG